VVGTKRLKVFDLELEAMPDRRLPGMCALLHDRGHREAFGLSCNGGEQLLADAIEQIFERRVVVSVPKHRLMSRPRQHLIKLGIGSE
jgi:hypothetical protein